MSAYMVDREHIDVIVSLALHGPGGVPVAPDSPAVMGFPLSWHAQALHDAESFEVFCEGARRLVAHDSLVCGDGDRTPSQVGQLLVDANVESIHARYPDTLHGGSMPGPCEPYWEHPYVFTDHRCRLSAVEGLKAIECLDYQSCEFEGWRSSEARRFLAALRDYLIDCLDGMRAAPWSWDANELAARGGAMRAI